MFEETLQVLHKFLLEDNGIVTEIKIKEFNGLIEVSYTSKDYFPNQLTILKSGDSTSRVFNINSFYDALNNIGYNDYYDAFYVWEPSSIYEGFGLSNYQRKFTNAIVSLFNLMNENADFSFEIQNKLNILQVIK